MLLVLYDMTTEQQILKILIEENRPLKVTEIAVKFSSYFKKVISKNEIKHVLYNQLKDKVQSNLFPFKRFYLLNRELAIIDLKLMAENKNIDTSSDSIDNQFNSTLSKHERLIERFITKPFIKYKEHAINLSNNDRLYLDDINGDYQFAIEYNGPENSDEVFILIDKYKALFYKNRNNTSSLEKNKSIFLSKIASIIEGVIIHNVDLLDVSDYLDDDFLIHKQIVGNEVFKKDYYLIWRSNSLRYNPSHDEIHKNLFKHNINFSLEILHLIEFFNKCEIDLSRLERKPQNIKSDFKSLNDKIILKSNTLKDKIVSNIIQGNVPLSLLQDICSRKLYKLIETDKNIYNWLENKKDLDSHSSKLYQDKLNEFKILCQKVWEDGIVDDDEQLEIDNRIHDLSLDLEDANKIFNQIKGEFEESHLLENYDSNLQNKTQFLFDDNINIDNKDFYFKIIDQPMSPLFWHKFEEGLEIIYINKLHNQYNAFELPQLKKIITAICVTKLSFSSNQGDIFENRFKNYLELL